MNADTDIAQLGQWLAEYARIRDDQHANDLKRDLYESGAWDQAIAMQDLQRQLNESRT